MADDRSYKEKQAALSRAVTKNWSSKSARTYYNRESMKLAKQRVEEKRRKKRAEEALAAAKEKAARIEKNRMIASPKKEKK